MSPCFRKGCPNEGVAMPVISFGPKDARTAFRLEVPVLICSADQLTFNPHDYFSPESREQMTVALLAANKEPPEWDFLTLNWLPSSHPVYEELRGSREARLWWG